MSNVYPFAYEGLAEEMLEDLNQYQDVAGGAFDLSGIVEMVLLLKDKFRMLDEEIRDMNNLGQMDEAQRENAGRLNRLCMDLNRILIPVHYCRNGDLFQADLAVPIPAFPEFDQLPRLASLDKDQDGFKFLERQLVRGRNRVHYFLRQALLRLMAEGR